MKHQSENQSDDEEEGEYEDEYDPEEENEDATKSKLTSLRKKKSSVNQTKSNNTKFMSEQSNDYQPKNEFVTRG